MVQMAGSPSLQLRADSQRPANNKGPFEFLVLLGSLDDSSQFVSLKLSFLETTEKLQKGQRQPEEGKGLSWGN
jgi:hypothetical protein